MKFGEIADMLWLSQVFENVNIADTLEKSKVLVPQRGLCYMAGICNAQLNRLALKLQRKSQSVLKLLLYAIACLTKLECYLSKIQSHPHNP